MQAFCCFCGGELDQFVRWLFSLVFVEDCRHAELAVLCVGERRRAPLPG